MKVKYSLIPSRKGNTWVGYLIFEKKDIPKVIKELKDTPKLVKLKGK